MTQVSFEVRGMHCAGCSERLDRSLMQLEGVREAAGELAAGTVDVGFDATAVTEAAIRARIREAGFEVTP